MKPLNLVVTGAAGFIGREVVSIAVSRGHHVRAIVRRADAVHPDWTKGVTPVVSDIRQSDALEASLQGADAVIHLAAAMKGDAATQQRDTIDGTRKLCAAMAAQSAIPRLVLISSISVYAHDAVAEGGVIDEHSPLETAPESREIYCQNKLVQEEIARSFQASDGMDVTILRPGAVFGPNQLWNGHLGATAGPVLVQFTRSGDLPAVYVRNCALAIVKACEAQVPGPVNLIDEHPPDRATYLKAIGWQKPTVVLPWRLMALLGKVLPIRAKPGLLHPATLQARMMPVRYDTTGMQHLMKGETLTCFEDAIRASGEGSS